MSISSASSCSMYSMDFLIAGIVSPGGSGTVSSKSETRAIHFLLEGGESRKLGNGIARHDEVFRVDLQPDAPQSQRGRGGNRGACPHEGIQDCAHAERQRGADKLPQNTLALQRRRGS